MLEKVKQPAKVARNLGNVDAEFAKGGKVMEAVYYTPMAAHASMEPPAAVAEFRNGKAEVWCPTQNPQAAQETVAAALGIDKSNVICHVTLLGGGFGRKSKPDYAAEAAILAKKLGKPVKVVWTREDDIRHDFYHTNAAVYHKATVDAKGRPTAWLKRSVFPPIASTFGAPEPMNFELNMGLDDSPYDIAEHPCGERRRRRARAHRLVPRGDEQLPRVCAALLRRRNGARGEARSARVPARPARPGEGDRPEGAGRGLHELRRADRQVPGRHASSASRARGGG